MVHVGTFGLYRNIRELEKGLLAACVLYTHSPGGSILSQPFIWRVPDDYDVEAALTLNQEVIEKLKPNLPVYTVQERCGWSS